jgi:hypothetical protein
MRVSLGFRVQSGVPRRQPPRSDEDYRHPPKNPENSGTLSFQNEE